MLGMKMGPKEELSSDGDFQCHLDNLCSRVAREFLLLLLLHRWAFLYEGEWRRRRRRRIEIAWDLFR